MSSKLYTAEHVLAKNYLESTLAYLIARLSSHYCYVDGFNIFLKRFPRRAEIQFFRQHCRKPFPTDDPPIDQHYKVTWIFQGPDGEILRFIHQRFGGSDGYKLIYAVVSLDLVFPTQEDADLAQNMFRTNLAQSRRPIDARKEHFYQGDYSDYDHRHARNRNMGYSDRTCRQTGELYCAHRDWQLGTAAAIRDAGIFDLLGLGNLDASAFWRHKLRLRALDIEKLGRVRAPSKRRGPWIKNGINQHVYAGVAFLHMIQTAEAMTIDDVVQACRKRKMKYYRALISVDGSGLIPPASRLFMSNDSHYITQRPSL